MRAAVIAFLLGTTALICPPAAALADPCGSLAGYVVETSNDLPISGATIVIESSSDVRKTSSDAHGHYVALGLIPGSYTITVTRPGYSLVQMVSVIVRPSQQSFAKIAMPRSLVMVFREFTVHMNSDLVQPQRTVDVSIVRWNVPFFDGPLDLNYSLNTVPGVQSGGAAYPR